MGIIFLVSSSHEAENSTISVELQINVISLHDPGFICPRN